MKSCSNRKKVIAMDIAVSRSGGPYISTMNIVNSKLKEDYEFHTFDYDPKIGHTISIRRILDLKRKIEAIHPDIVHFSGLQLSGFHIAVACKLARVKKSIVVIHGSSLEAIQFAKHKKVIMAILEFITLLLVDFCYGVSKYASQLPVVRLFKHKNLGHIYNLATINFEVESNVIRADLGFTNEDIVVTSVARITREKGYAVLSEAICADNNPQVKYLIVGNGEYLKVMKENHRDDIKKGKVVFLGKRGDIGSLLKLSDIFVLPTLHETLSVSLLEASNASLPLIASEVGGVPEVVINGENGYLVPAGDALRLSEAISELVGNPAKRKTMGYNALLHVKNVFNEDIILHHISNVYNR